MKRALLVLVCLAIAGRASAQVSVTADRIFLGSTGCAMRTGAGAPTGGAACDFYLDTTTGHVWQRVGATWINVSTRTPTFDTVNVTTSLAVPRINPVGPLTLAPSGAVVLDPGSRSVIPGSNFGVSLGAPEQKFLALHLGELWAESLVAQDVLATIGGRVIVAPTTILSADFSTSATTITVKANTLRNGDRVYLQTAPNGIPQVEWLAVTSAASGSAGAYTYSVVRNLDGSGVNQWYAGDAVVDTGTTGNGLIDLYALRGILTGYGPTIVGSVRTGPGFNEIKPRWAIGNLRDVGYGHFADYFGIAFGDPQGAYTYYDDNNGIVMGGPGGVRVQISPSGVATFAGDGNGVTNIDGGHIAANTITANAIAAGAITSAKIAAGSITTDKLAAGSITSDKIASGSGTNQIRNSECRVGTSEWFISENTGLAYTLSFNYPGYNLGAESSTCFVTYGGTPPAGSLTLPINAQNIPAKPGQRYEASVYLGVHRMGYAQVEIQFLDGSLNALLNVDGNPCRMADGVGGQTLAGYCRSGAIGTAPAGTVFARMFIYGNQSGEAQPYVFWVRAYLGEAKINQTELSEWTPPGLTEITGGIIRTGAISADKIAAGAITADKIAAGAISADKIAAGTITGDKIAGDTITGDHIAAGSITAADIAAGSISADRLNVSALSAISANLGNVNAGSITSVNITGGRIDGTDIYGTTIHGGTITGGSISGGTMSAASISGGSISGTNITGVNIDGSTIKAGGGQVTIDGNGITVGDGNSAGQARIKLGGIDFWGGGGSLWSNGGFDVGGGLRSHGEISSDSNARLNGTIYTATPAVVGGGYAVWYDVGCGCITRLSSSTRYKENVRAWSPPDPLAILSLPLYRYDVKNQPGISFPGKNRVGFTVEDLARISPDAIQRDKDGRPDGFYGDTIDAYMIAALRAVNARVSIVEELQQKIADLEKRIAILERRRGGNQ